MRSSAVLGLILVCALPAHAVIKARKCPDGSFVVDTPMLVPADGVASRYDAVGLAGKKVSIGSGCSAKRARLQRTRRGTRLRARWKACGSVERVLLRGLIDKDCSTFAGTIKAKGVSEKTFTGFFEPKYPAALDDGTPVDATIDCGQAPVADAVEQLCQLLGVAPCVAQTSHCSTHRRQLFTGTRLTNAPAPQGQWNGRGGSGELMADAVLCSLRELSPEIGGPIVSKPAAVSLGLLGTIEVTQEVGFTRFDRLRERFEGYRRVEVDMPVIGKAQVVTQTLVFDKTLLGGHSFSAGSYPIYAAHALDVETQDKEKILQFTPPGFTVPTPLGTVTVSPQFTYGTRAAVVEAPYGDEAPGSPQNSANDVASLFPGADPPWTVRLFDLYGINPGLASTATATQPGNFGAVRSGWASQIGFGTRAGVLGQGYYVPPASGTIARPDANLLFPRSTTEATPSVYAAASATVAWPSDPHELLPSWVFQIPFLFPPTAQLTVTPTVEAGVASQLFATVSEGADHAPTGEFQFQSRRLSAMTLLASAGTVGSFKVDAGVRISVRADFPFPVGERTFVDIDKKFPIPLAGGVSPGPVAAAAATSFSDGGPDFPAELEGIQTFKTTHAGAAAAASFIEQCYAPQELQPQPVPQPTPTPGHPADLVDGVLWPCNICIYTNGHPQLDLGTLEAQYEAGRATHPEWPPWPAAIPADWIAVLVPAATPPVWRCNTYDNTGCYDLCTYDPQTAALTVALGPDQISPLLPPTADYDDERLLLFRCDYEPPA